jgi:hypothetical protein
MVTKSLDPRLLEEIARLDGEGLAELLAAVAERLKEAAAAAGQRARLSDLAGVGEELWRGMGVEKYLDGERDEWT